MCILYGVWVKPLDVARDDQAWDRYLHWLSHFRVARDRTQALVEPSKWAALSAVPPADDTFTDLSPTPHDLPLERRMLVLGWTWPDRDLADPDVFRTEICSEPRGALAADARAADMSSVVGGELVMRMLRVADVTDQTFDEVLRHVTTERLREPAGGSSPGFVLSPSIGVDHLELLAAGQVPVDLQTLIQVSEDLHLVFGRRGWRIENPKTLKVEIRRSQLAAEMALQAQQMPLAEAEMMAVEARQRAARRGGDDEEAAVDPERFDELLRTPPALPGRRGPDTKYRTAPPPDNPMHALYSRLQEEAGPIVKLRVAVIDEWVREVANAPGAKHDGRRTSTDGGLPSQAFESSSWWTNGYSRGRTQVRSWQAAGFKVQPPKLVDGTVEEVTFVEQPGRSEWHKVRNRIRANTYRRPSEDAHDLAAPDRRSGFQFGWQTRAALLPGALAGEDFHFAWLSILLRTTHHGVRLRTNPPEVR